MERGTDESRPSGPREGAASSYGDHGPPDRAQDVSAFEGFIRELRRRHVFNVVFLYALIAFPLLGNAAEIIPYLPIPGDAGTQMAIRVALTPARFPVILVLSCVFDISATAIGRTECGVSGAPRVGCQLL